MADPEPNSEHDDVFEVDRIRSLLELMEEFELREIDLRQAEQRIRLSRGAEAVSPPISPPSQAAPIPVPSSAPDSSTIGSEDDKFTYIKSPMVGTFYSRPNPKTEPYVSAGDQVDPETTVCIIEAMKVFNEIPAEVSGRIVAVLVDDEESVEFGKPLFKVDAGS